MNNKLIQMEVFMKANIRMGRCMDMVHLPLQNNLNIVDKILKIKCMEEEFMNEKMVGNMKEIEKIIKWKEMGITIEVMVALMKESIKMIQEKDGELLNDQMVEVIKVCDIEVNNMEMDILMKKTAIRGMELGLMDP